jgi:hypothetical protein
MPVFAAVMDNTAATHLFSDWNLSQSSLRVLDSVQPSILMNLLKKKKMKHDSQL